jgi:hypothetical protein
MNFPSGLKGETWVNCLCTLLPSCVFLFLDGLSERWLAMIATVNGQSIRPLSTLFRRRFVNLGPILLSSYTYCALFRSQNPVCVSLGRSSVVLYTVNALQCFSGFKMVQAKVMPTTVGPTTRVGSRNGAMPTFR